MLKLKNLFRNDDGAAGIGTLIIFIAMVLVAAVAASVLINTSSTLQQKAQTTGKETIADVSSTIKVNTIVGYRSNISNNGLDFINLTLSPGAGAGKIDFNQTVIKLSNGAKYIQNLRYDSVANTADSDSFSITEFRDADGSYISLDSPVLNSGDLVKITLRVDSAGMDMAFPVRQTLGLEIYPETGAPVLINFVTPSTYNTDTIIPLYP